MSTWLKSGTALLGVVVLAAGCRKADDDMGEAGSSMGQMAGAVEYTVVFKSRWTAASHPFEYPTASAVSGPHFSGVIGASHNGGFHLFAEGAMPTPGLERLSEMGRHSPLDEELQAQLTGGAVGQVFTTGPLRDFADSLVATVTVDTAHPMVSLVAMIAPSPDWFTGAADVNLMQNGAWVPAASADLYAWDSGGDTGGTYKAADADADPKQPTMRAGSRHFVANGAPVPVATVTFTRRM